MTGMSWGTADGYRYLKKENGRLYAYENDQLIAHTKSSQTIDTKEKAQSIFAAMIEIAGRYSECEMEG